MKKVIISAFITAFFGSFLLAMEEKNKIVESFQNKINERAKAIEFWLEVGKGQDDLEKLKKCVAVEKEMREFATTHQQIINNRANALERKLIRKFSEMGNVKELVKWYEESTKPANKVELEIDLKGAGQKECKAGQDS